MDLAEYQKINAIIARDSADATYKYASSAASSRSASSPRT